LAKKPVNLPKDPFNAATQTPEIEIVFESDFDNTLGDEDENTLRSNTDPKHDPKNVKNRGLTPPGTPSMFGRPRNQGQEPPKKEEPIRGQPASKERQEELRNGNYTVEDEFNGLRVRTRLVGAPSKNGLRGGQIEEIVLTEGDLDQEIELAHFKEGKWELTPETTPVRQSISEAVEKYDPECLKSNEKSEDARKSSHHGINIGNDKNNGYPR